MRITRASCAGRLPRICFTCSGPRAPAVHHRRRTTEHPCVLSLFLLAFVVSVDLPAQRLPIRAYATADGLAHNRVNRIVRDSRGFMWFCTGGGLSRFDGHEFANFGTAAGLPHSSVNDLLETRAGAYWVATDGGLVRFDPTGASTRRVVDQHEAVATTPMFTVVTPDDADSAASAVTVLRESRDGTIWVGTNAGLYRLARAGRHWVLRAVDIRLPNDFPEQRVISDVLEDALGSLWVAAPSGLYRRWPDGSAARYARRDGLPDDYIQDLLEDHSGRLWVATRHNGFFSLRTDTTRRAPVVDRAFTYRPTFPSRPPDVLPTSWVHRLFETSDKRFWLATARGLVEFFPAANDRGSFRVYAARNGLSGHEITALAEDVGGNLWLGTGSAGMMKLARGGIRGYSRLEGIESVNSIFEDRVGHLCFRGSVLGDARTSVFEGGKPDLLRGDEAVLHTRFGCFDKERFEWFTPAALKGFGWVGEDVTLQRRNGEWWVAGSNGVYRFPPTASFAQLETARPLAHYTTKDGLSSPQVFRLFEDSRGDVWISTIDSVANGLARWDRSSASIHDFTHAPGLRQFSDDRPRSFAEDRAGNVWIGFDDGLTRYANGRFTSFTAREGLPKGKIRDIHVDRAGRLWLASDGGGLVRVDNAGAERPTFVRHTTAHGLSSDNSEVIVEDADGRLYVGGGHGLDRFDPATRRVKHFTTEDGLASGIFRAAFRDRAGVLWFGMTGGLSRLAPSVQQPMVPPRTLITGLRVAGVPHPVSAVGEREVTLPDLASGRNQLEIDFVGLGAGPGDVLRYQYRLDGADARWSAPGEQRTVTYASLAPGRYAFAVRALNSDGVASDAPALIGFTILPPLWLRWWSFTTAAFALGLTLYALYRYRVRRLLEVANIRTRIASDLHDDIGANLVRIALLSEVARRTDGPARNTDADAPLASITRIARESVSAMSDIVWAISPKRESLLDLTRRMRQHADEVFTLRGITLRFDAPSAAESVRLGVDARRDVLLIFKEAVSNAARHSRCSHVEIDVRIEGSRLRMDVTDDGIGYDAAAERDGQGVPSMQRRARQLGGTVEITAAAGAGTAVRLDIPR